MHRYLLFKAWLIASFCCNFAFADFTSVSLTTGSLAGSTLEHKINLSDPNANGQDTITIRYTDADPTESPIAAPADASGEDGFIRVPFIGVLSFLSFRYRLNRNDVNANGVDTISIKFTCPGNVWVGVGVSEFGAMVPAKTVIGYPDSGETPLLHLNSARQRAGVTPLPDDKQVLIKSQIVFANDETTLSYTIPVYSTDMIMADPGLEVHADRRGQNFIYACGRNSSPSTFHQWYGSLQTVLEYSDETEVPAPVPVTPAPTITAPTPAPAPEASFRQVSLSGSLAEAEFQYRLNRNDPMAEGADTITIEYSCPGNVWVGVGVSEFGAMAPSKSVIAFPNSGNAPVRYLMESRSLNAVNPLPEDQQNLIDPQITFANDRTTLRYTIPIFQEGATTTANLENEALEIHTDGRNNNFIGACGTTPGTSFHRTYGSFGVVVEEGATEAPAVASPFAAPTNPPGAEVLQLTEDLTGSTLSYHFTSGDPNTGGRDSITVTYTAPVTAWVAVGASESGMMVGSDAVIGIPATGEIKKYTLSSKGDLSGIKVMPDEKQTLVNAAITQANGMTTLTYTKILVESGEIPINRAGDNIFIAAYGSSNTLGFHSARGAFALSGEVIERDNSLWSIHGLLAFIAWGVLCPLAILAGLFRKYIPGQGMWYQIHRTLQGLVVLLTIASVVVAIIALNEETPANLSADHFNVNFVDGHRLIGLVVLIVAVVQGANGIFRPHIPPKPEETPEGAPPPQPAEKSGARKFWEVLHRLLGAGLLALTWYQVYLGIFWYNEIFNDGDSESSLTVFYAVIGVLGGFIVIGVVLRVLKD